jgi:outer membrane immunogenic protein
LIARERGQLSPASVGGCPAISRKRDKSGLLLTMLNKWWHGIVSIGFSLSYIPGPLGWAMHRFSTVAITAVSIVAFTQIARGADIPVKSPRPFVAPSPALNWTGLYAGGNVGGAWLKTDWTFFNGATFEPTSQTGSSWVAGAQIGYLYQFNRNWVAGLEVSWSGTELKENTASLAVADRVRESKISDLLLVTGRLGYAADNWLGYVKSGYANSKIGFNTFVASTGLASSTSSSRDGGWTVGGGVEYAFNSYVSAGLEYNFVRLNIGDRDQSVSPGFVTPETVTGANADIQTVWARLNFRFAPLIRSY